MGETPSDGRRGDVRGAAVAVARRLARAGYTAYFAGGCVRDALMGLEPKDYDIATDARPEQVRAVFPRARAVGEAFGVMLVRSGGHQIEVATFRTDGDYVDGRHPEEVRFSDAEHDARRRDFTINGLFENPETGEIVDYVGGRADIAARQIRAIGDPEDRLREDHLRMLRAVRFAARFAFAIETETAESIRRRAGALAGVSRERIGHEIRMMLADPNRAVAVWELQYLGLDGAVLDEPSLLGAPLRVGRLPAEVAVPTALAAWRLDRGDGRDFDIARTVDAWGDALVLSTAERRAMAGCLEVHRTLGAGWSRLGTAAQKRLAASPPFEAGLLLLRTESAQEFVDVRRRVLELSETGLAPEPLITGEDLIGAGMRPGPLFREILDAVYDAQLEGSVVTGAEALALAMALAGSEAPPGPKKPPRREL